MQDNFKSWEANIMMHLRARALRGYALGTVPKPATHNPDNPQDPWIVKDSRATGLMLGTLSTEVMKALTRSGWTCDDTAKQTLDAIRRVTLQLPKATIGQTLCEFYSLKAHNFANLDKYQERLAWCWERITAVYTDQNEEQYVHAALQGLKEGYSEFYNLWLRDICKGKFPTKPDIDRFLQQQGALQKSAGTGQTYASNNRRRGITRG
ncbi:hypothetical protein CDD81_6944 [Ophiocordyceps australis]|uniref:Retrotransposon Copia-like N-terminal domain-containing protein n=1 Tax=Ophiocordyceps australis TaxID=1399860 RepID=A0A2C5XBT2_9HYPO|nr:hypothetical protein CDD81_6944 [Ophiocordyceps australis]